MISGILFLTYRCQRRYLLPNAAMEIFNSGCFLVLAIFYWMLISLMELVLLRSYYLGFSCKVQSNIYLCMHVFA
jgi:hypothetical protein